MNYITSCPACETQFLLSQDHLKAYRGKVQCGHCNHVFNAKNRLTEVSDEVQNVDDLSSAEQIEDVDADIDKPSAADIAAEKTTQQVKYNYTTDDKPISEVLNVVLDTVPNLTDLGTVTDATVNQESHSRYSSNTNLTPVTEANIDINALRAPIFIEDLTADPNFQLNKPKRNKWLILAVILLFIAAIVQTIYFLRSTIAAHYPEYTPYLEQVCSNLNCTIDLPRHLELLTIDDSDMQESDDYQDVINFSSLLINSAPHAQAFPNIELTLTDIDDKPVLRKLVRPQEYLNSGVNIVDGMIAREEVRINLAINVQNLSVAGYRVQLTY